MHPLAFQLLTCVSLAAFGDGNVANVALGMLGNIGHDALKKIPGPRLRPQGQPNHDLHKALAEAIADTAHDLDLESIIRTETNSLRDLKGGAHHSIEEFLRRLQKSPAEVLRIEAQNSQLKTFLENPSPETFAPIAPFLGEQHLPGLSPEVREIIVQRLFLRISERYWDRIKNTPAAWNAYSAEVFREFRKTLADQGEAQREIIAKLDVIGHLDRLIITPPPLSENPKAGEAIDSLRADLRGDIDILGRKLDTLQMTADLTLREAGEIRKQGKSVSFRLLIALAAILLLGFGGHFAHRSTQGKLDTIIRKQKQPLDKARIRLHLIEASEKSLAADLAEAGAIKGDWEKRQKLNDAAQDAHRQRLSRVDELTEEFAAIESGKNASAVLTEMMRILEEEGLDQSLAYLASRSDGLLENATAQTADVYRQLQPLLSGAELAIANGQTEKAEALFLKLIAPEIVSWPDARHEYFEYLTFIKGPREQAYGTLSAALAIYQEAERQASILAFQDPGNIIWQRDLSAISSKLGNIAMAQGDVAAAEASYTVALGIMEKLAAREPGNTIWQRDLAIAHSKLGHIAELRGDLPAAKASFANALEIREKYAARNPANTDWQRELSIIHERLGDIALAQGDLPVAESSYATNFDIAQKLAFRYPGDSERQRDLSIIHNRLGDVAKAKGDLAAAESSYTAAMGIMDQLAAGDPENNDWQRDRHISHNRLGDISRMNGDVTAAKDSYDAGLAIAEKLVARDPENTVWLADLHANHRNLGEVAVAQGNLAAGKASFVASLGIARKLSALDPHNAQWQRDLSVIHGELGDIDLAQGDAAAAKASFAAGLEIAKSLVARDPGNAVWQRDLAACHSNLGNLAMSLGDLTAAKVSHSACMDVMRELAAGNPEYKDRQRDLAICHEKLGDIDFAQRRFPSAKIFYAASLGIREKLVGHDRGNTVWLRDLSTSHERVGDIAMAQGDPAAAKASYSKSLEMRKELVDRDPENAVWLRDLSLSHSKLGEIALGRGDLSDAQTSYSSALGIMGKLTVRDAENSGWMRDVFVCHLKLAGIADRRGDKAKVRGHLRQAHDALEGIAKAGKHLSPKDMDFLRSIKEDLGIK